LSNCNPGDLQIWENLFAATPEEIWKTAPASQAMEACRDFFVENGVRSVLDIGCGVGRWAIYLAKNGLQVKGTDFSANAVGIARNWASEEELSVEFSCRTLTETAFPGERFEGVVAALILDNVSREEMLIGVKLIRECLVGKGYLFALFNPIDTREARDAQFECENPTAGITQMNSTNSEIISALLGFEVLRQGTYEAQMRAFFLRKSGDKLTERLLSPAEGTL
jgi:cyclopropane fatty-acyl-phospholipid synthase-like methyltransferase